ncbi:AEG_G0017560.mRNA.1.CDS.1 [Saccharomyces cerevisiae]|uniref:YFR016C-like protein n=1 Tax=Saccharomyces cerevisiae (strain JAY291) TaxID=574961 RepID=C7GYC2_YEAS2|nr:YFR016C-like protein [Saccharomyces cerevisiae JAY291]CAI4452300.1 AEG_G0017560.mRNA.1.CDS.1 [Saccharomyces cerevisiae]CAI4457386.1 AEH_G0017530.mRNA.1.CDS.1 [Saccharomyces cerevisiae]CAI6648410.1 AEH_G0017530.mRNA.1.CDS.1 [Saccharomyces cerevisiae]CAI6649351.1 AEG_G0017560.mRNA.1.CDS.1 [Saccharomyces cerevisiae]
MVESLTVENQEHNVQPPSVTSAGDSYSTLATDLPLPSTNDIIESRDQLTESDLDEAINATENFAQELSSQRKSSKLKGHKKKNQGQIKANRDRDTIVKLSSSVGETEEASTRDAISHDLERKDDVIEIATDTINDATESPTQIPIDVNVVIKETSTNNVAEGTENVPPIKESTGIEVGNSPITRRKKNKKKKTTNRRSRNSSNPADTTDLSKQSTLDSILVGIEEYLQEDGSKNEDIKVNIVQDEPVNVEKMDIGTRNESSDETFDIDVPNKDNVDETSSKSENNINEEKAEHTLPREENEILNVNEGNAASFKHQLEPHGLEGGDENGQASTKDVESESLTKNGFNFKENESKHLKAGEKQQTESDRDGISPSVLAKNEKETEIGKEDHVFEQKDKEDEKCRKELSVNHENNMSHNFNAAGSDSIIPPETERETYDDETMGPTKRISDNEKNLQHGTNDISVEVEKEEEEEEEEEENSTFSKVKKENVTGEQEAVRNNEVSGTEEESTSKGEEIMGGDEKQSEAGEKSSIIEIEGSANSAKISKDNLVLEDEAEAPTQENKPTEVVGEIDIPDAPRDDVEIVEAVEKNIIPEDLEVAKEDQEGEQVKLDEPVKAMKDDKIAMRGAESISEDMKKKQEGTAELSNEKAKKEVDETARESAEGVEVEKAKTPESPKVVKRCTSGRPEDLQINERDPEILEEDVRVPDEDVKPEIATTIENSEEEDPKSQRVQISTEQAETTQKDMGDVGSTTSFKEEEKPKRFEITQEGDKITGKDTNHEHGEATEAASENPKASDVGTAEKYIEPSSESVKKDTEEDAEVENSEKTECIKVKAELENLDAPKEAGVIAEQDKEDEDVEVAATSKEDIETKCSEPAETLIEDGTCTEAEVSKKDAEAVTKEDENMKNSKIAEALKDVTGDQEIDDINISDEFQRTVELPELEKQDIKDNKGEDKELEVEETEKETSLPDLVVEENITEEKNEIKQEEEEVSQLDFNETESISKEAPNNDENGFEDQSTRENPKKASADDIFKDILDETNEFLEQLKIVDDSELNALLQSLDAKDSTTQTTEQSKKNNDKPQDVITTSEIRKLNEKEPVYIYTSLAGGGFHMIPRTNRLSTILTANRIPFTYRDLGTDDEARKVWKTFSKGRSLPGVVRGHNDLIGNWEEIEEANEDYKLRELIYDTI